MHYGEGAYDETEREIQALLGVERELVAPLRPEDAPGVLLPAQTADQPGAYSGPVRGRRRLGGARGRAARCAPTARAIAVDGPGAYPLVEHPRHTRGVLELELGDGRDLPRHVLHAGVP